MATCVQGEVTSWLLGYCSVRTHIFTGANPSSAPGVGGGVLAVPCVARPALGHLTLWLNLSLLAGMNFDPEKWPVTKPHCDMPDALSPCKTITDALYGIMSLD